MCVPTIAQGHEKPSALTAVEQRAAKPQNRTFDSKKNARPQGSGRTVSVRDALAIFASWFFARSW
jgi:hypothetical protein